MQEQKARTNHANLYSQLYSDPKAALILTKEDWNKLRKLASGNKIGGM